MVKKRNEDERGKGGKTMKCRGGEKHGGVRETNIEVKGVNGEAECF